MNKKLPNTYIVQAICGICLLIAGAVSTIIICDKLLYLVCIFIESFLLHILIKAIKRRDKPYAYTMAGTMICIIALAILIGNIVNNHEALSPGFGI